ncbi:hypothetical protein JW835_16725 [bacterium]|nr:hypothetical protein [bacterium]
MFYKAIMMICLILSVSSYSVMADEGWIETEEYSYDVRPDQLLEILLDVDAGEITVTPNDSSGQCLIRLSYPIDDCKAEVDYHEKTAFLKVRLDTRGWSSDNDDNDDHMRADILLPKDIEMTLKTRVKAGEVLLDVGGLRLKEFRLRVWAGEVNVHFDSPNPIVMDYMDISTSIGELNTSRLGNARFKRARINGGIGEIDVDLSGDCLDKAMAKVDLDIGEADVILPCDRGVRLSIGGMFGFLSSKNIHGDFYKHGSYYYSECYEEAEQSISVRITPGLGELNIDCD